MLGMITVPPGEEKYGLEDNVRFYYTDTENDLGYHVPILFDQFIAQHGGDEISGDPIADLMRYREDDTNRQCYQNYCLEYHQEAPDSLKIRLTPLGIRYKNMLEEQGRSPFSDEAPEAQQQPAPNSSEQNNEMPIPDSDNQENEKQEQVDPAQEQLAVEEPVANQENQPADQSEQPGSTNPEKSARKKPFPKGEVLPKQSTQEQNQPDQEPQTIQEPSQPSSSPPQPENNFPESLDPASIVLLICEQKPQIPASGGQIIHLVVHKKDNLDPVPGLVAKITVSTPNGERVYIAPPTGSGGRASIAIDPMPEVENGSLITYQVCIDTGTDQPLCEYASYLIWNYQ